MPVRGASQMARMTMSAPWNPLAYTPYAQQFLAGTEVFERVTRRYGKPAWALPTTVIDGREVAITEETLIRRTYCHLLHFKRDAERDDPTILVVEPLSGHFAALMRGPVAAVLQIGRAACRERVGPEV